MAARQQLLEEIYDLGLDFPGVQNLRTEVLSQILSGNKSYQYNIEQRITPYAAGIAPRVARNPPVYRLNVPEIKERLSRAGVQYPTGATRAELVRLYEAL